MEQFIPAFTGYLNMKGIVDAEEQEMLIQQVAAETPNIDADGAQEVEILNMLLFKDIVCGLWNQRISTMQAMYQLVNATDLNLALKGYLYDSADSSKVSSNFKKIADKINTLGDDADFEAFKDLVLTDTTWVPLQKEYRPIYVFLLLNAASLLYCEESHEEF